MAFPTYIPCRTVTMGGAIAIESGALLAISVTVRSTRSLVWDATGFRFESVQTVFKSETDGAEVTLSLPCTDSPGWRDAKTRDLIDVSAPDSYSHLYTLTVVAGGNQYSYGPFALPAGDGSPVDLDTVIPSSTVAGGAVTIPDSWSVAVAEAQQAAADAAASAAEAASSGGVTDEALAAHVGTGGAFDNKLLATIDVTVAAPSARTAVSQVNGGTVIIPPAAAVFLNEQPSAWFEAGYSAGSYFDLTRPSAITHVLFTLDPASVGSVEVAIYAAVMRGADASGAVLVARVQRTALVDVSTLTPDVFGAVSIPFQDTPVLPAGMYVYAFRATTTAVKVPNAIGGVIRNFRLGYGSYPNFDSDFAEEEPGGRCVPLTFVCKAPGKVGTATFLGDSITALDDWANIGVLAAGNRYDRVNRGIGGNSTTNMLARVADVVADNPALAVILGGTNDVPYVEASETITNLGAIIDAILAATQARVLIGTIPPRGSIPPDADVPTINGRRAVVNASIRQMRNPRVGVIDWSSALSTGDDMTYDPVLFTDHVHPNIRGQRIMGAYLGLAI